MADAVVRDVKSGSPTAALLTPIGRGAVATIRVVGELNRLDRTSLFEAANGRSLSQQPVGRIALGHWGNHADGGEDVVVCRVAADVMEIHCHGGDAAARRILADLDQAGFRTEDWRNQLADSLEVDLASALARATTWRTAEILNEQASGVLRRAFEQVLETVSSNLPATIHQIDGLLNWARFGKHLSEPWTVVLTGRPNVGKSSLINALLGYQRAIVFDQPGTTRDVVTAETAFDGWPVLLADTAGLRAADEELEVAGIALARRQLEQADARLVLVDLSQPPTEEDEQLMAEWQDAIVIGHKCDLPDCWGDRLPGSAIRASSVTGEGLDSIQRRLVEQLVPHVPEVGTGVPVSQRQIELLRVGRERLLKGDNVEAKQALERLFDDSDGKEVV